MAIFLVQHGKCLPKDQDPEKGLSSEGMAEVRRVADVARSYGVQPAVVIHSGKKRARQTAETFAGILEPPGGVSQRSDMAPLDDVSVVADTLDASQETMLVGHLPFMERLCAFLITGNGDPPVFRFQNGGIVCMDRHPDSGGWVIRWALMPHIG